MSFGVEKFQNLKILKCELCLWDSNSVCFFYYLPSPHDSRLSMFARLSRCGQWGRRSNVHTSFRAAIWWNGEWAKKLSRYSRLTFSNFRFKFLYSRCSSFNRREVKRWTTLRNVCHRVCGRIKWIEKENSLNYRVWNFLFLNFNERRKREKVAIIFQLMHPVTFVWWWLDLMIQWRDYWIWLDAEKNGSTLYF